MHSLHGYYEASVGEIPGPLPVSSPDLFVNILPSYTGI